MKKIFMPVMLLIFVPSVWNECHTQMKNTIPKNFISLFGGIEWNTLSSLSGAEYQRVLWKKSKLTGGVKGVYIFRHDNGNLELLNWSYGGFSSFAGLMPTVHYFTSARKDDSGFFLHSGLGIGRRTHEFDGASYHRTIASFEAGLGYQFNLGPGARLTWTNSVLFAGEGGITLSKISVAL